MKIKNNLSLFQKMIGLVGSAITLLAGHHEAAFAPPDIKVSFWIDGETGEWNNQTVTNLDDDEPVTFVNQSIYILTSQVLIVTFLCTASYPLEWDFSHAKWLLSHEDTIGVYGTATRRISIDTDNPKTFTYWSQIAFFGDPKLYDGQYICKSAIDNDPSKRSNFTLFWEGGPFDNPFVLSDRNLTVWIDKTDKIIFPCHVTDPFVEVSLLQQNLIVNQTITEETWTPVPLSSKLTFQSDVGFIYERATLSDPWMEPGVYKCVAGKPSENEDDDENDFVLINLIDATEPEVKLDNPITSNATIKQDKQDSVTVECCSSTATPPRLSMYPCGNPSACKQLHIAMQNEVYNEQLSRVFRLGTTSRSNGSCTSAWVWAGRGQHDVIVARCVGDGIDVAREFWISNNPLNLSYHDLDKPSLEKWVEIQPPRMLAKKVTVDKKLETYSVYAGQLITFQCKIPLYFFSYGVRWVVTFKDGTTRAEPDYFDTGLPYRFPYTFLQQVSPLTIPATINVTSEMASLTCLAPVSNSADWIRKTVFLSVKQPLKPTIDTTNMENTYWNLNDTDRTIECKTAGDPDPKVIWMKDNKIVLGSQFNISRHHDDTYILHIPLVTHDVQGEFKCISMNFAGRVEQVINVFVEESNAAAITTTVFVILFILLLLIGGIFIIRKTLLQTKSLENLHGSVYNNPQGPSGIS